MIKHPVYVLENVGEIKEVQKFLKDLALKGIIVHLHSSHYT
jgi:hypothetical protein